MEARTLRAIALVLLLVGGAIPAAAATALVVEAPPSLESAAARIRSLDLARLTEDLSRAGLTLPPEVQVTLIPGDEARASGVPEWIVGLASGSTDVVIFPDRLVSYPYGSLESVLRHEMVHLALSLRAGARPLPRWFHEGVAVSVDAGWSVSSELQLLLAMRTRRDLASVARLFRAGTQPESALAYRLSTALVDDLRRRHGSEVPGAIAARVADGTAFDQAFRIETGESPDEAAATAWAAYRRWTAWVSALTSDAMPWAVILALAFLAFIGRARQRARHRRRWDQEDDRGERAD